MRRNSVLGNYIRRVITSFVIFLFVTPLAIQLKSADPKDTSSPKITELGTLVESVTLEHRLQFNPQNRRILVLYYVLAQRGSKPFQIVSIDLNDGTNRVVEAIPGRPGPQGTLLHSNGLIYIGSGDPGYFMAYDPESGQTRQIAKLADKGAQYIIEGDDGAIYIGECVKGYVERYDPKNQSWENYGIIDDPGPPYYRYAYTLGADGRYIYIAIGQRPWYLVVLDRMDRTSQVYWKDLLATNVGVSRGQDGSWYARLSTREAGTRWYRLKGKEPPELVKHPPKIRPNNLTRINKAGDDYEIDLDRAVPDSTTGGTALVRWRKKGATDWQEARFKVRLGPMDIKRLYPAPDGKLFGFISFYGPVFIYDLAKKKVEVLGRPQRSLYDALFHEGEWFLVGYPAATLRYNTRMPWNLSASTKDLYGPLVNPHLLKVDPKASAKYHYYLAKGADGFIYFGGHHERSGVGGSLGWLHPKTRVTGGLRQPFLKHDVRDLISIEQGGKLVFSSHAIDSGGEGKLFLFDVQEKKLLGDLIPLPGNRNTGKIVEVKPGIVLGVVPGTPKSHIYKADLQQQQILWRRELPGRAFGNLRSFDRRLIKGPDGFVWLYVDDTICRVNPENGSYEEVIKAPPAGNLIFSGKDLYIYGGASLRRVSGVLP